MVSATVCTAACRFNQTNLMRALFLLRRARKFLAFDDAIACRVPRDATKSRAYQQILKRACRNFLNTQLNANVLTPVC